MSSSSTARVTFGQVVTSSSLARVKFLSISSDDPSLVLTSSWWLQEEVKRSATTNNNSFGDEEGVDGPYLEAEDFISETSSFRLETSSSRVERRPVTSSLRLQG